MLTHKFLRIFLLAAVLVSLLMACDGQQEKPGVVARVNGRPILLTQLEIKHDSLQLGSAQSTPSVNRIRHEYGTILADLVVRELVAQALETRGLVVTDNEVAAAEAEIRADYPEGAFEEVLVEEYIDINFWREELRARLALEKFFNEVLRPGITLDYKEAETYYREHIKDFYLPQRVRFVRVSGPSRDVVENAIKMYRKSGDLHAVTSEYDQVQAREIIMREDRITMGWRDALKGLSPGAVSGIMTADQGFESLIFYERIPDTVLDPSQAYPYVERELVDQKLQDAFNSWLETALASADIVVTPLLPLEAQAPAPAVTATPSEEGGTGVEAAPEGVPSESDQP